MKSLQKKLLVKQVFLDCRIFTWKLIELHVALGVLEEVDVEIFGPVGEMDDIFFESIRGEVNKILRTKGK